MKKDIVVAVVAVVIVLAVAFGLSQFRPNVPGTPSQPFSGDAGDKKLAPNEKVVMRVNGDPITDREFAQFMENVPAEQRTFYASPAGRRALADELVKLKVLEQEAKRLGVADDPKVKQQIAMAQSQITAARALEKLAETKLDEKVRAEYEKEKGTAVSLRHILIAYAGGGVPAKGGAKAPSEAQAMQRAQAIAAKLRGGADFARTAMAESDDEQSGAQGGMIGPARPETLPPDIAAVVTKLRPGQMSDPVKTQFGVHIFKVEQPSLEELDPVLRQRVRQQTAESEIKRLQEGAKVDLDPQFFPEGPQMPGAPKSQG
ncbi:MAG TPA: peptidylprolyl isomerase [Thermoanaerobaculia bacterium]